MNFGDLLTDTGKKFINDIIVTAPFSMLLQAQVYDEYLKNKI